MATDVQALRRIDLHLHTHFSDGTSSLEDVVRVAQNRGLTYTAITDHYSAFQELPKRMTPRALHAYLQALEGVNAFKGLEVEILDDGTVSMAPPTKTAFDLILGGLHILQGTRFWGDATPILNPHGFVEAIRVALITAMESRLLDVIAHVTWLPPSLHHQADTLLDAAWADSVVDAASDFDVAMELNGAWRVPHEAFVERCVHHGVKLSLGSDAHTLHAIGHTAYGVTLLQALDVPHELIYLPHHLTL